MTKKNKRKNIINHLNKLKDTISTMKSMYELAFPNTATDFYDDELTAISNAILFINNQASKIKRLRQEIEGYEDSLKETLNVMTDYANQLEPRKMTLEEVQRADAVWLETYGWKGGDVSETVLRIENDFSDYITEFIDKSGTEISCENSQYEIDWRAWTSCPKNKEI